MAVEVNKYNMHKKVEELTKEVSHLNSKFDLFCAQLTTEIQKHTVRGCAGPRGEKGDTGPVGPAGESIVGPKGDKGERGDVLLVCDAVAQAALLEAQQQIANQRAAFLAAIAQAEYDARGDSSVHQIIRNRIAQLKKDAVL